MTVIEKFRRFIGGRTPPSAAQIGKLLVEAEAERDAALSRAAILEGERADAVLAGRGDAHRNTIAAAKAAADDAEVVVEALRERHAKAIAAETEAARQTAYNAALALRDAAAARLKAEYVAHVEGLRDLLSAVTEADVAVEAINRDLPHGAGAISPVEEQVRDRPGVPEQILSEREIEAWVGYGSNKPAADQSGIFDLGNGRGHRKIATAHGSIVNEFWRGRFVERRIIPAVPGAWGTRLARTDLPALIAGDPEPWSDPGSHVSADGILRRLNEARAPAGAPDAPTILTTYELIVDAEPATAPAAAE